MLVKIGLAALIHETSENKNKSLLLSCAAINHYSNKRV